VENVVFNENFIEQALNKLKEKHNLNSVIIELKYHQMGDLVARASYKDYHNGNKNEFVIEIFPPFIKEKHQDTILAHEIIHVKDTIRWLSNSEPDYRYAISNDLKGELVRLIWDISIDMRMREFSGVLGEEYRLKKFRERKININGIRYRINNKFCLDQEIKKIEDLIESNKLNFDTMKNMAEQKFNFYKTYLEKNE